jgi:RNA polymerase sigma-70 factor (ECF subfamily)
MRDNQAAMDLPAMIRAARLGDEGAFGRLMDYYRKTAERVARHILRTEEAAADAVQEAMIKVHRAMPRFEEGNFRSWLLRIVTNTCYDHLRRQKRRSTISLEKLLEESCTEFPAPEASHNPETIIIRQEQMDALLAAIGGLSSWHRDVILLVDVQGYDYAEAAEILDLPLGTVKSRLSRARSSLRNELVKSNLIAVPTPA